MKGVGRLARGGAWALMPLFVAAAAGWRLIHPAAPWVAEAGKVPAAGGPRPPPAASAMQVPPPEAASAPPEGRRKSRPGTGRWYREEAGSRLAADPAGFERAARERLAARVPLAEKTALLKACLGGDPEIADRLYALALDTERTLDPPLQEAAFDLLLREVRRIGPRSRAGERLWSFLTVPGFKASPNLRRRGATVLYAAAPEHRLDLYVSKAELDSDPEFLRAAWRGLARNPVPRARELADELALRRGWEREGPLSAGGGEPEDGER